MSDDEKTTDFQTVMSTARRWYWQEVRDFTDSYLERAKQHEFDSREALDEDLQQTLDGSELIIYTSQAWAVCFASDNDDAYEDEIGEKPPTIEVQAFYALRADVLRMLEANDIDALIDALIEGAEDADSDGSELDDEPAREDLEHTDEEEV